MIAYGFLAWHGHLNWYGINTQTPGQASWAIYQYILESSILSHRIMVIIKLILNSSCYC